MIDLRKPAAGLKPKMPGARDLAVALGLVAGALIVLTTPRSWYLRLCRMFACASSKGATTARIASDIGGIPADRAASIGRELSAWKLMEGLLVIRGLLLGAILRSTARARKACEMPWPRDAARSFGSATSRSRATWSRWGCASSATATCMSADLSMVFRNLRSGLLISTPSAPDMKNALCVDVC
jgi:hypothetical protein